MRVRKTSTADDGRYRIAALSPGEYRLTFSLAGFASRVHDVRVAIGFTATVDVVLEVATQREEITVSGRNGVLDRQSTAITETFDAALLCRSARLAQHGWSLSTAKAVSYPYGRRRQQRSLRRGPERVRRSSSPRHTVEGIVVTGLFGPASRWTTDRSKRCRSSPGPRRGVADPGVHTQIVTKSGGNRYRGALDRGLREQALAVVQRR